MSEREELEQRLRTLEREELEQRLRTLDREREREELEQRLRTLDRGHSRDRFKRKRSRSRSRKRRSRSRKRRSRSRKRRSRSCRRSRSRKRRSRTRSERKDEPAEAAPRGELWAEPAEAAPRQYSPRGERVQQWWGCYTCGGDHMKRDCPQGGGGKEPHWPEQGKDKKGAKNWQPKDKSKGDWTGQQKGHKGRSKGKSGKRAAWAEGPWDPRNCFDCVAQGSEAVVVFAEGDEKPYKCLVCGVEYEMPGFCWQHTASSRYHAENLTTTRAAEYGDGDKRIAVAQLLDLSQFEQAQVNRDLREKAKWAKPGQ